MYVFIGWGFCVGLVFSSFFLLFLIFTLEEGNVLEEYCHTGWVLSKLRGVVLAAWLYMGNSYLWWYQCRGPSSGTAACTALVAWTACVYFCASSLERDSCFLCCWASPDTSQAAQWSPSGDYSTCLDLCQPLRGVQTALINRGINLYMPLVLPLDLVLVSSFWFYLLVRS